MTPQERKDMPAAIEDGPPGHAVYSLYCWLLFSVILFAFGLLIIFWPGKPARRRQLARTGARLLFRLARLPLRSEGLERLPSGQHIVVANHTSFLDALILTAALPAPPGYAFVARQEFRSQVLLWPLLRAVGTVIVHGHASHATPTNIERLADALENGENLIIFPEGDIRRTSGVLPFHSGAFVVAAKCRVPVVPVGIRGARQALPLKSWQPACTPVAVLIGPVLRPEGDEGRPPDDTAQAAREIIALLAGEALVPAPGRKP